MYDDGTNQSLIRYYTYGRGVWESPFTNVRALNTLISVNSESDPSCNAHTVTFGDVSTGVPLSYSWSFPGGTPSTSSSPNPTITYTSSGTYNITLTITDASSNTSTQTISKTIQLFPQTSSAISIVSNPISSTVCAGGSVTLTASGGVAPTTVTLGTGVLVTLGNTSASTLGPNPLQNYYGGSKQLMLFTVNELKSLGLFSGTQLSGFAVNLAATNNAYVLQNLQVKIQNTSLTSLSSFITTGWAVVRNAANYTITGVGWNTIPFTTNFTWSGTSNILIEVNYSNNNAGSSGNTALYGATSNVSTLFYRVDNATATTLDTYSGSPNSSYSSRNNVRFSVVNSPITYSWLPVSGLNTSSGTIVIASPTATTNYTVTASSPGSCPISTSKLVTVNICNITFNLKAFLQGFYVSANTMRPALFNSGVSTNALECDSITVELRDPLNLTSVAYSRTTVIKIDGTATMQFPIAVNNNSYYIVLRHRNSLETWSKSAKLFTTGNAIMMDFTAP